MSSHEWISFPDIDEIFEIDNEVRMKTRELIN